MTGGGVLLGAVSPHPPIVIPEIGEKNLSRVQKTRDGLQQLAHLVREIKPETVVIVTPHGPIVRGGVTLLAKPILEGNFREFGISGMSLRYGNDTRLVAKITEEGAGLGLRVHQAERAELASLRPPDTLHYSVLVPLYYLRQAGFEGRLVAACMGLLPAEKYFRFGQAVRAAALATETRVVYIASGDLSHRLAEGAPAGYDPAGKVFDRQVVEALARADVRALVKLDPDLVEKAGECGLGPIVSMFGALDGDVLMPDVISYEGPFGVGYCVAVLTPRPGSRRAPPPSEKHAVGEGETGVSEKGEIDVSEKTEPDSPGGAPAGDLMTPTPNRPLKSLPPELPDEVGPTGSVAGPAVSEILEVAAADPGLPAATDPGSIAAADPSPPAAADPGSIAAADPSPPPAADPSPIAAADPSPPAASSSVPAQEPRASHPFVRLARLALETYVREGRAIAPPPSSPGLDRRAGAFVSLKRGGELRGCIGTLQPTTPSLAEEVIRNAIQSGTADPRFSPVKVAELSSLSYSVDVLEPAEEVGAIEDLDPKIYGVIVAKGQRAGVLLPDLEGIETSEEQIGIARQKAGLSPRETGVKLFRFRVSRFR